ncbi:MAG: FHA domain-containing protein [Clostridiales Family XIII bacterium]|nr:FHA domain-containing protein [Clostridiales Family XIII bacterium]
MGKPESAFMGWFKKLRYRRKAGDEDALSAPPTEERIALRSSMSDASEAETTFFSSPTDEGTAPSSEAETTFFSSPTDEGTAPPSEAETTLLSSPTDEGTAPPSEAETTLLSSPTDEGTASSSEAETSLPVPLSVPEAASSPAGACGVGRGCDETVPLDELERETPVYAFLIRGRTGERIPIGRSFFTIGKAGDNVDFMVEGRTSVSRCHADIVFEGGACFIIDNDSTNRTFVEGVAIKPREKVEMENGALFTLGDENFQVFMEAG